LRYIMIEPKDVLGPIASLVATFGGAWLAFRIERKRRSDEEEKHRSGAANRALYTLFNFWNILEQHRKEVIEPYRAKNDAWLNMAATPPVKAGSMSFEAGDLAFLLETENSMVYATLLLEEQRLAHTLGLIEMRSSIVLNEVFPRFAKASVNVGSALPEPDIARILGIDIVHKLRLVTAAVVKEVDAGLKSTVAAHDQLRIAMKRVYPERQFVKVEFRVPTEPDA
jgi:hypothetical protein